MNRQDPLNGIHLFLTVVEAGNFSKAAAMLSVTPAAVSLRIGQLETELTVKLFHRSTRSVSLTEAGEWFYHSVAPFYQHILNAREGLHQSQNLPSGHLRITAVQMAKELLKAPFWAEFNRLYPQITLEINYEDHLIDIIQERIDVGIRLADKLQPGMVGVQITPELPCALIATQEYIEQYGAPNNVDELQHHRCIRFRFPDRGILHKWSLTDGEKEYDIDIPGIFITDNTEAIIEAARAGIGIAHVFLRHRIKRELETGTLVEVMPGYCRSLPPMWVYYANRKYVPKKVRVFIDALKHHSKTLAW
ncbi:D-malate degradation protein R [Serratia entomophila]|uniref:LysR family transcriptional regulator n=1 Tax=Serratia entomophila TaxID=42906 RepID=A0ABY5CKY1_9GAMM|nr:LysR family transcriptional regulator [Serratia entomophila]UIW16246.1 LysR family transcriptional regulator [Serratia entomophila]USU98803.1 LysR family transcriptional regulator [Serratia entomophila]CAI0709646.1 D-malate degradation protein R [Serratia entomophila]CAI0800206.1 D-malate degradation protein R [Serratia entomophila]CAI0810502.1 D-malate degradation protein R [Serratia entomophila]